jgi:hypothetical protein
MELQTESGVKKPEPLDWSAECRNRKDSMTQLSLMVYVRNGFTFTIAFKFNQIYVKGYNTLAPLFLASGFSNIHFFSLLPGSGCIYATRRIS